LGRPIVLVWMARGTRTGGARCVMLGDPRDARSRYSRGVCSRLRGLQISRARLSAPTGCSRPANRRTGVVRLIREPRLPRRCPSGTRRFTFNVQGPEGSPGATGPTGPVGPAGVPGPQGIAGTPGTPGDDGHTILHGAGAPPDSLGADGDFYLDDVASTCTGRRPEAPGRRSGPA
jgi:hypothetical protein